MQLRPLRYEAGVARSYRVVAFEGAHTGDFGDAVWTEQLDDVIGPSGVQRLCVGGDRGVRAGRDRCLGRCVHRSPRFR